MLYLYIIFYTLRIGFQPSLILCSIKFEWINLQYTVAINYDIILSKDPETTTTSLEFVEAEVRWESPAIKLESLENNQIKPGLWIRVVFTRIWIRTPRKNRIRNRRSRKKTGSGTDLWEKDQMKPGLQIKWVLPGSGPDFREKKPIRIRPPKRPGFGSDPRKKPEYGF